MLEGIIEHTSQKIEEKDRKQGKNKKVKGWKSNIQIIGIPGRKKKPEKTGTRE